MEYQQIIAATERQFAEEERDVGVHQAEVDTAQALLDRRRRALKRKKSSFERLMRNFRDLDVEVISGKPSRSDAAVEDDEPDDDRNELAGGEAA